MKLLITGVNGFVAGSILVQAKSKFEIFGVDLTVNEDLPESVSFQQLDLTDETQLSAYFLKVQPDVIIHTAAIANIDVCQNNQELAKRVNVDVTATLAKLCREHDKKLIFCSTDTVFDGIKGKYTESDQPFALNFYAETKIAAERIVLESSSKNIVARLSLVMGLPVIGKGNSFLADMIEKFGKGLFVQFPANEIRTPVDVVTLGAALTELAGSEFSGIIHLSGNTRINRYEMAVFIAEMLGYPSSLVDSTDSNAIPGRAPRPNDASMVNDLVKNTLKTPMKSLEDGLKLTLNFNTKA